MYPLMHGLPTAAEAHGHWAIALWQKTPTQLGGVEWGGVGWGGVGWGGGSEAKLKYFVYLKCVAKIGLQFVTADSWLLHTPSTRTQKNRPPIRGPLNRFHFFRRESSLAWVGGWVGRSAGVC